MTAALRLARHFLPYGDLFWRSPLSTCFCICSTYEHVAGTLHAISLFNYILCIAQSCVNMLPLPKITLVMAKQQTCTLSTLGGMALPPTPIR